MKRLDLVKLTTSSIALMLTMGITVFAGEWKHDSVGWWFSNGSNSYPASQWMWIDGNNDGTAECYYFNQAGYLLVNTTTPDGYMVNGDGAWIVGGLVQTKQTGNSNPSSIKTSNSNISKSNKSNKNKTKKKDNESNESQDNDDDDNGSSILWLATQPANLTEGNTWRYNTDSTKSGYITMNVKWSNQNPMREYYLGGKYREFTTEIRPSGAYGHDSNSTQIRVYGDNNILLDTSPEIDANTEQFIFTADVSGQEYVRIVQADTDPNNIEGYDGKEIYLVRPQFRK